MKKTLVIAFVAVILLSASGYMLVSSATPHKSRTSPVTAFNATNLLPEVEQVIAKKMELLVAFAKDAAVHVAVKDASAKNGSLSKSDIQKLDEHWVNASDDDPFVRAHLEGDAATALKEFQRLHPEFIEISVSEIHGLNVALTNRTSDYVQSDEQWWVMAYNGGAGNAHHGSIEFDESVRAEAISLYVPIIHEGYVLGVMRAVIDLAVLRSEV